MWQCLKCPESVEDNFDACWNCGAARDGTEDPLFQKADNGLATGEPIEFEAAPARQSEPAMQRDIQCRDCNVQTTALGQIAFMRKSASAFWNFVAAVSDRDASNLETIPIDVLRCPQCGRLELYDFDHSELAP